MKEREGGCN